MDPSEGSFNLKDLLNSKIQFKLGLNCMKHNVAEVDAAVRELSGSTLVGIFNLPSWKYPHEKVENLDIPTLMNYLEQSGESEEMTYVHMSELLIDRLYYALLSSIQYLSMISGMIGEGEDNSFLKPNAAEGDSATGTHGENFQTTNMAGVIRKLHEKFRNLESGVHKFKMHKGDMSRRPVSTPRMNSVQVTPLAQAPIIKTAIGITQTDESRINACASCEATQSVLKFIGDILEQSWNNVSNEEPSQIGLAKTEIKNELIWGSQWGAVSRWCNAIKIDTANIVRKIAENMKINCKLEAELQSVKSTINRHKRDHELAMEKSDRKNTRLRSSLDEIKKERVILLQFKTDSEFQLQDLRNQLSVRDQAISKHAQERKKLETALIGLEKIHQELISSQKTTSENLNQIKCHLENERKSKIKLQNKVKEFENQEAKILQLTEENTKLHEENEDYETKISECNDKLELLTLYPDLNGPINPPTASSIESEPKNLVEAMEKQIQSNSVRIEILHQQSSKLSTTLDKLKAFVYQM